MENSVLRVIIRMYVSESYVNHVLSLKVLSLYRKRNSAKTIKLLSRLVYVKIWRKITVFVVLCHVLDRFLSRTLYKQWNYKWPLVCPLFVGHISRGFSAWKIFYDCLLFCYRWEIRKKRVSRELPLVWYVLLEYSSV